MTRPTKFGRILTLFVVLGIITACGAPATQTPAGQASGGAEASAATSAAAESASAAASTAASPAAESSSAGGTASPQETLVYAGDFSDQLTMDPAAVYEFGGIQVVGNVYETLVSFDPGDPTIKPVLASSWDIQEGSDAWTVTFKLNPDAKFASGNPVTADDVVYSWSRAIDLNASPAFLFTDIAQLKKENLRAVDPQTVEVKLPKSASPQVFLSILTFTIGAIVEKAIVEQNAGSDNGSSWLNDHSAGSGPYVMERWDRNTQNVLAVNTNYWGKAPAIKRVIMRNITELANLQSAVETGEADMIAGLGAEQIQVLQSNPDIQIVKAEGTQLQYLGMNAKKAPLDKPEVREAIRYAINYEEIVNNLLGGNATLVQEIIPKGLFGHTGTVPFKQDIAKAKELLSTAGVAEGTEIELLVGSGTAAGGIDISLLASKLQSDIQQTGLKITIKQVQSSEVLNIYRAQNAQLVLVNWGPDFPDPDGNVTPFTDFEAKSIAWRNQWEAPEVAALAKQAALEQDNTKRADLYKQIVERVQHEGPYAILYQPSVTFAVRSNVQGIKYDAADTPSLSFWLLSKQ